jgi:hypothetical protein
MNKIIVMFCFIVLASNTYGQEIKLLNELEANAYLGKYKLEIQEIQAEGEIRYSHNYLYFFTEGIPELKLIQLPEIDKFRAEKYEIILQFLRNDFKEIEAAKIWFQGKEFLAKKINF